MSPVSTETSETFHSATVLSLCGALEKCAGTVVGGGYHHHRQLHEEGEEVDRFLSPERSYAVRSLSTPSAACAAARRATGTR